MPFPPTLTRIQLPSRRQILAALVWVVYVISALGLPLPGDWFSGTAIGANTKDLTVPFPCQHKNCGCRNAAQCYRSCCCHTPAERRAFARRHGLDVGKLDIPDQVSGPAKQSSGCCATKACCQSSAKVVAPAACCETKQAACVVTPEPQQRQPSSPVPDQIVWREALGCQGVATSAVGVALGLCWDPPCLLGLIEPVEYLSLSNDVTASRGDLPAVPPPRV